MRNLDDLLTPIRTEEFMNEFWEKDFLYIERHSPSYYDSTLTFDDVINYISRNDIRYPALRLIKNGINIPLENYTNNLVLGSHTFSNLIDHEKLHQEIINGTTVQLQYLHLGVKSLENVCSSFETTHQMQMQANVYLTPSNAQGFAPHYDTHSVFILQVYGEKTWWLYNTPHHFPLKNQQFNKHQWIKDDSNKKQVTLVPGDLLYIPRGMVHEAFTDNDKTSLHITLGVIAINWIDIFYELFNSLQQRKEFRKSLPMDSQGYPDLELIKKDFGMLLEKLPTFCDPIHLWNKHLESIRSKHMTSDPVRLKSIIANK